MQSSRPNTPWRRFSQSFLAPALVVIACLGGGFAGAWGLPRAIIVATPHASKWVVYGGMVVGIFGGGLAGLFIADFLTRRLGMLFRRH